MGGDVKQVYTCPTGGLPLEAVPEAVLEVGRGIVGDRYYERTGTFSKKLKGSRDTEVTLIESEEISRFNAEYGLSLYPGDLRRNIVTNDVRLNDLVGQRFRIGEVELEGLRLCEPCRYLAQKVTPKVLEGLVHRCGLRACVIQGGTIRSGDRVESDV